ncbi:MAG TPA: deoxyguanosinetriphosphate triphosphohydrolase [Burkholderiaceae bacterium]
MAQAPLAPYASDPAKTRGRRHPEPAAPTRSDYQRDRDRIVHSTAFRRLVYKTQVFLNHEGDLFRTRLTHSLEVAQLGRSMARSLLLDEDLVETIALAHDLGHTPFGHAGQDVLDDCMKSHGGFEHNLQSLRVVDQLEQRYPAFDGLNLTFESREGILKHCSRRNAEALEAMEPGGVASRFLSGQQPSLEAQLCNLADEVAYNAHDIDDGVRSGLIDLEQLEGAVPLVRRHLRETLKEYPALTGKRLLFETIRRMLTAQVYDITDATRAALDETQPVDAAGVRASPPLVRFSPAMREASTALKRFLFANLYRHPQVTGTRVRAEEVLRDLFALYQADANLLPPEFAAQPNRARACADYMAGMTDRYALREHQRLTGKQLF